MRFAGSTQIDARSSRVPNTGCPDSGSECLLSTRTGQLGDRAGLASSTLVSVFDDPIAPIGRRVVGTPLPDEGSLGAAGDGSRAR